jgi:hypothetical protein
MEAGQWWEIMLNIRPQRGGYDPMGGGTAWSQGGIGGQPEVVFFKVVNCLRFKIIY